MKFIYMKSFIYGHIHPCKWIKITSSFKLRAQSLDFMLMHKPSSTHLQAHKSLCNLGDFLATCYNTLTGSQVLV